MFNTYRDECLPVFFLTCFQPCSGFWSPVNIDGYKYGLQEALMAIEQGV